MSASGGKPEPKTESAYPKLGEQIPFASTQDNFVVVTQIFLVAKRFCCCDCFVPSSILCLLIVYSS